MCAGPALRLRTTRQLLLGIFNHMSSISILMATYNGSQFLESQLESLAVQSKLPSELIVSDDCSTDDTISIVQRFVKHSPFPVHIHTNSRNKGYRQNFIDATMFCTSSLVAFCDQDDVWNKDKLLLVSERFTDESVLLCYHNARVVDINGNFIDILWPKGLFRDCSKPLTTGPWSFSVGFTQIFRRDLIWFGHLWARSIDYYWPNERLAHDQWFFFLASVFGRIAYVDQELVDYRQHDNNVFGVGWDISIVDGKKKRGNGSLSLLRTLPYISEQDGKRFAERATIADNRVGILNNIVKEEVYLPIIRQRAMVALFQYSALAERFNLQAQIYQRPQFINRLVAWLKLVQVKAYGSGSLWLFSGKAAARDALVGVLLGPRIRVVLRRIQMVQGRPRSRPLSRKGPEAGDESYG
jgi:glycosyltransferase involved in cell wall biosynthesis